MERIPKRNSSNVAVAGMQGERRLSWSSNRINKGDSCGSADSIALSASDEAFRQFSMRTTLILMREACGNEALEEGMRSVRFRLKFRVELAGKKPGMALDLNQFD